MSDKKMLLMVVLALGGLVGIWWFGFFGGVTDQFLQIKKYTVHSR